MSDLSLRASIEALLFVSGEALSVGRLSRILKTPPDEIREALSRLKEDLAHSDRGLALVTKDDQALLAAKQAAAPVVEELTKSAMQENLSKAAFEVLAIIAYRAPITRSEIEAIRGVNCSFTLRNLLLRDLVEREGNPEDNRGYIYRPTFRLLQTLGLEQVEDLPDYAVLAEDDRLRQFVTEPSENNLL